MSGLFESAVGATDVGDVRDRLQQWRTTHPRATLREIEAEVERCLAPVRAGLLLATAATGADDARPTCPDCGRAMQRVGTRRRTVTTTQNEALLLQGPGYRCAVCGTGVFPPRGDARSGD